MDGINTLKGKIKKINGKINRKKTQRSQGFHKTQKKHNKKMKLHIHTIVSTAEKMDSEI